MSVDVYVLESTGVITNSGDSYTVPLVKCLKNLGYNPQVISLVYDTDKLSLLSPNIPIIIAGGSTKVNAYFDWLDQTKDFLKQKLKSNIVANSPTPILGIGFGAELLAYVMSLGAITYHYTFPIKEKTVNLTDKGFLLRGMQNDFDVYACNDVKITVNDLTSIISKDTSSITPSANIFEIRQVSCFGVHFYPEFTRSDYVALLEYHLDRDTSFEPLDEAFKSTIKDIDNSKILANFMSLTKTLK